MKSEKECSRIGETGSRNKRPRRVESPLKMSKASMTESLLRKKVMEKAMMVEMSLKKPKVRERKRKLRKERARRLPVEMTMRTISRSSRLVQVR